MSLVGKNRAFFSYNAQDKHGSNFMYKDFEKSNSYRSNFDNCNFNFASLRAAKFKYCTFRNSTFKETEFIGTNLRGSNFENALFEGAIFNATVLDSTKFRGVTFKDTIFIGNSFPVANLPMGITFINKMPPIEEFSVGLYQIVEALRSNDIVRRSNTLHLKRKRINTVYLTLLLKAIPEDQLIQALTLLPGYLSTQFYTLSYLKKILNKIVNDVKL